MSRAAATAALPGLLAVAAGLYGLCTGVELGLWEGTAPNAGFFPVIVGGLLAAAGLHIAVTDVRAATGTPREPIRRMVLAGYVAGLAGFALLMEPLGGIAVIVLLFLWLLAAVERLPWRVTLPVTAASSFGAWLLFERLLEVPLPHGPFG